MKMIIRLLLILFSIGFVLVVVSMLGGASFEDLKTFFNDDASYGNPITYTSSSELSTIDIDLETRNIYFLPTTDDHVKVFYQAHDEDTWVISESSGVLYISQHKPQNTWNVFNFKYVSKDVITVFISVPDRLLFDYIIKNNVGDIKIVESPMMIGNMTISSNTGNLEILGQEIKSLNMSLNTGNITLNQLDVELELDVATDTGKININQLTASQMYADSNTGKITVTDTSISGQIELSTSTGDVKVENTIGLEYDISSSTGNVIFDSSTALDLKYELSTSVGNIKINDQNQGTTHSTSTGTILLKIKVSTGNITINV